MKSGAGARLRRSAVPYPERSLREGAIHPWTMPRYENKRRALAEFLDFLGRRNACRTNKKLFLPSDFGAPDHLREQTAHHRFDRAAIIIRHPAG